MRVALIGEDRIEEEDREELRSNLMNKATRCAASGAKEFLVAYTGEFAEMCIEVLNEVKEKYPRIRIVLTVSRFGAHNTEGVDEISYPIVQEELGLQGLYGEMIEKADYSVFFVKYRTSEVHQSLVYATVMDKLYENLYYDAISCEIKNVKTTKRKARLWRTV